MNRTNTAKLFAAAALTAAAALLGAACTNDSDGDSPDAAVSGANAPLAGGVEMQDAAAMALARAFDAKAGGHLRLRHGPASP